MTSALDGGAYSMYLQLHFIPGGGLLHPQHEDAPCHGDRDPHNVGGGGGEY
jgi:hypothetical protein